ncbi:MAG: hypothetical protein IKC94_04745 [Lentisphaeria bacterium]|nr:hypothetical protein [Lentisphaeria bacterium]
MLTLETKNEKYPEHDSGSVNRLSIAGFYGDYAIFQHGKCSVVRGRGLPLAKVELTIGDLRLAAFANSFGDFTFKLPPMAPASGLTMQISSAGESLTFKDIAVGNVYVAAGQSNMQFAMSNAVPSDEVLTDENIAGVRCFLIPPASFYGTASSVPGRWRIATREYLRDFSALAGFFAAELYRLTGIPVGIISACQGGVNIESFISEYSLLNSKVYHEEMPQYERIVSSLDTGSDTLPESEEKLRRAIEKLFPEIPDDGGIEKGFCNRDFDDSEWPEMLLPDSWTQAGHNHAGIFYFRKKITLPPGSAGGRFTLHLGAVDKADKTFINGICAGETGDMRKFDHWNSLRVYEIPENILCDGENTIAIQASSLVSICADGGLLGPAEEMYIASADGKIKIPLTGKWKYCETFDAGTIGMTCMRSFGAGGSNSFHNYFDNMIRPIEGTALAGVIWYQGEANAICMGKSYAELLTLMIEDWRRNFLDADLNFYIIQLTDFQTRHTFAPFATWPLIREAQNEAAKLTGSSLVVTIGSGDVTDIHPVNKKAIADRIARDEAAKIAGKKYRLPQLQKISTSDGGVILNFDGALDTSSIPGSLIIAGKDMYAVKAEVRFTAPDTLFAYHPEVKEPFAVWYAWAENPRSTGLFSADQRPLSPFRAALDGSKPTGKNLID